MSTTLASLPYTEPSVVTILVFTTFLLVLNIVNHVLDKLLYCGLVGQIFIGVAWGSPGAKWLDQETEEVVVKLGYLGLLLIVYEGELPNHGGRDESAKSALQVGSPLLLRP